MSDWPVKAVASIPLPTDLAEDVMAFKADLEAAERLWREMTPAQRKQAWEEMFAQDVCGECGRPYEEDE